MRNERLTKRLGNVGKIGGKWGEKSAEGCGLLTHSFRMPFVTRVMRTYVLVYREKIEIVIMVIKTFN